MRHPAHSSRKEMPQRRHSPRRLGFTLLELLLVLGVLVVIGSLSWPRMMRYVQENALKQNVDTVRRELASTRMHAIESGLTYQFRYEPAGQQFLVLPFERPTVADSEKSGSANPSNQPATTTKAKTVEGRISADFRFETPTEASGPRTGGQHLSDQWLSLLKNGAQYSQTTWSPPILFRANGESQDAQLVVKDKTGNSIKLSVRGLTGAVRVEPLQRPETRP
ncbi:MAG: prepilin-type N-terminal cleavage/methylation domain-containing protein [Planctomycetaceae bacterium]